MNAFLTADEVSDMLGIPPGNFERSQLHPMRLESCRFPQPVVIGACRRWRRSDIEAWIELRGLPTKRVDHRGPFKRVSVGLAHVDTWLEDLDGNRITDEQALAMSRPSQPATRFRINLD